MKELKDDNGKTLPKTVQKRMDTFVDSLKEYPWFKPSADIKKADVDKQAKFTLDCFGIKAEVEYKVLSSTQDWASAGDSAWASAWDSAWASARDSAWASAWASARDSARASAWASARDSARDSARASGEFLLEGKRNEFNTKYPNGAFKQLLKLWEMGLYPVGVLKETGKFVIYADPVAVNLFKSNITNKPLQNIAARLTEQARGLQESVSELNGLVGKPL